MSNCVNRSSITTNGQTKRFFKGLDNLSLVTCWLDFVPLYFYIVIKVRAHRNISSSASKYKFVCIPVHVRLLRNTRLSASPYKFVCIVGINFGCVSESDQVLNDLF